LKFVIGIRPEQQSSYIARLFAVKRVVQLFRVIKQGTVTNKEKTKLFD
jgi:hypothetical protein